MINFKALRNVATHTIKQELIFTGSEEGKLLALKQLVLEGRIHPPVLIFVQSKERAQQLFRELILDGLNVDAIHSDRTQAQRNRTVEKFRTGEVWILITTELMSRGIDFKGVNLVINYDFPQSITSYIHRIGRTGRAGRQGEAITFYTEQDFEFLRSIANVMKASGCDSVPQWIFDSLRPPKKQRKKEFEKHAIKRESIERGSFSNRKKKKLMKRKKSLKLQNPKKEI